MNLLCFFQLKKIVFYSSKIIHKMCSEISYFLLRVALVGSDVHNCTQIVVIAYKLWCNIESNEIMDGKLFKDIFCFMNYSTLEKIKQNYVFHFKKIYNKSS